jgi:hypothetical protein
VHDRAITMPTGKITVIRRLDTFKLAPWKAALEPFKGRAVTGMIGRELPSISIAVYRRQAK